MEILPIELFGVAIDVPFEAPRSFPLAKLDQIGGRLCDPVKGLSLHPNQLRLRRFDELFDYELNGRFFGDNGTLTITAERCKLAIRNARTMADWGIVQQTLVRFYHIMEFAPATLTHLSTHVHAKFSAAGERDDFMQQFAFSPAIDKPAALGYVRIPDWEKDVRVLMEKSNAVPDSVFVAWDTQFVNNQDWESFFSSLPNLMENSANLFELAFDPLR